MNGKNLDLHEFDLSLFEKRACKQNRTKGITMKIPYSSRKPLDFPRWPNSQAEVGEAGRLEAASGIALFLFK